MKTELTTADARNSINCYKSRKILKEKHPEIILPDKCQDILKIYNNKMIPKDFPDMVISDEQLEKWKKDMDEKGDGRSGDQLYENSNSDIK